MAASRALPDRLIDSHHHFWTGNAHFDPADYLPGQYLADSAGLRDALRATVFAECGAHYDASLPDALKSTGETRFAAAIGERFRDEAIQLAAAIVGHADPMADDVPFAEVVDAHLEAGRGRLRALRRSVAWDADDRFNYPALRTQAHMLLDDRFLRAAEIMAERGVALEIWLYHPQLGELARLAAAAPQCTIVLDHAGTPLASGRHADRDRTCGEWKDGIAGLAALPNVSVKMGGLITAGFGLDQQREQAGLAQWTVPGLAGALRPWLSHLLTHFGPDRCIFESNFPVDRQFCSLTTFVRAYSEALADLDDTQRNSVFFENAARTYGITPWELTA